MPRHVSAAKVVPCGGIRDILGFRYDEKEIDYERLLNRMNWAANPCIPIPPRHVPVITYTVLLSSLLQRVLNENILCRHSGGGRYRHHSPDARDRYR